VVNGGIPEHGGVVDPARKCPRVLGEIGGLLGNGLLRSIADQGDHTRASVTFVCPGQRRWF